MKTVQDIQKLIKRKRPPAADPVRHAEAKFGVPFLEKKTVSGWEHTISRHTTNEFARMDGGYRRHCGPTAITNLILTLDHRDGSLKTPVTAGDVFSAVSAIGKKKRIYWNTDLLGHFGGTYDILTGLYIRDCFRYYGITVPVRSDPVSTKRRALTALREGKLLYLQLHLHPVYGNHHLLCYGYTVLGSVNGKQREIYLILADGWSREPRYLRLAELGLCHFFEIG